MSLISVQYNGKTYVVPESGNNMDALIVADDDHAMAFLMQDGNLGVPGGRYGSDTADCAPVALAISHIMADASGEARTYYGLNGDMGLVVNESDDIVSLIMEHGTDADRELLDDEDRDGYVSDYDV